MFYGAQVWGYNEYESVEKLFRFFIKKILLLPKNTPNYMILIETGFSSQYFDTLKLHCKYIAKVLRYPDHRLPSILAKEIILRNVAWSRKWLNLCGDLGIQFNFNCNNLEMQLDDCLKIFLENEKTILVSKANNSQNHDAYYKLSHNALSYCSDQYKPIVISTILKTRGGLLNLNARCYSSNSNKLCILCNCNVEENTFHFIAQCPIFSFDRKYHFGKERLNEFEFLEILNGKNYYELYKYVISCTKYRNFIINDCY